MIAVLTEVTNIGIMNAIRSKVPSYADVCTLMNSVGLSEETDQGIHAEIKQLANRFRESGIGFGDHLLQIELDCVNLILRRDGLHPQFIWKNKHGRQFDAPDIRGFSTFHTAYISRRLDTTDSPLLRLRYNLVCLEVDKHNRFAEGALDCIIELTNYDLDRPKDERFKHNFRLSTLAAIGLRVAIQRLPNRLPMMLTQYWKIVDSVMGASDTRFRDRYDLLETLVDERKHLSGGDRSKLLSMCSLLSQQTESEKVPAGIEMALDLNSRLRRLLGEDTASWRRKKAEHFERLIDARGGKPTLWAFDYCLKALEIYKELGEAEKVKKLSARFETIKSNLRLEGIPITIDNMEQVAAERKSQIATFAELVEGDLLAALTFRSDILPVRTELEREVESSASETPLIYLVGRQILDSSKNVAKTTDWGSEENKMAQVLEDYSFHMDMYHIPVINGIIIEAIYGGRLTFRGYQEFMDKYCWYAQPQAIAVFPRVIRAFDWRGQLLTIVGEYFASLDLAQRDDRYQPNFQLCIDSLTTKIEGIIRCFAQLNGIVITKLTKRDDQTITENMNINDLLFNDDIIRLFGEDTILFLRWLLIEKSGQNLRHDVCHGLMQAAAYSIVKLHLLFLALLKISSYGLKSVDSDRA